MLFAKAYKIKGFETLKNTEKKGLIQRIFEEFPAAASDESSHSLISMKDVVTSVKITTNDGEQVKVYLVDGEPQFIDHLNGLLPTVYALWRMPNLIPTIVIHSGLLSKLQNGAPLYQPGVVVPVGCAGFPMFSRGVPLALCTADNAAAAAVGFAATSSADMLLNSCGVCLQPVHVSGDLLCKEAKFTRRDRPALPPPRYDAMHKAVVSSVPNSPRHEQQLTPHEEWPALTPRSRAPPLAPPISAPPLSASPLPAEQLDVDSLDINEDSILQEVEQNQVPTDMDELLRYCLLCFIKFELKKVELPLKTNLLYRKYLMPLCPSDRTLDVKKSSYKKVGKFLEAMQKEGLIEVREVEKGVDALTAAAPAHPALRALGPPGPALCPPGAAPCPPAPVSPAGDARYRPPLVREMYCVTAAVLTIFPHCRKGTPLQPGEVRAALTDYVKSRNLTQRGVVALDSVLADICGKDAQDIMKWEELMSIVQNKMTACTEMTFSDGTQKLNKSRLEPIKMQVVTRSGNKKVTLVSNLESFGFSLLELSKSCQTGAAASCGVTRAPGARADQLMLQGDQTYFIAKLLIEKYGLPKKYVEGADKALKKKNK